MNRINYSKITTPTLSKYVTQINLKIITLKEVIKKKVHTV